VGTGLKRLFIHAPVDRAVSERLIDNVQNNFLILNRGKISRRDNAGRVGRAGLSSFLDFHFCFYKRGFIAADEALYRRKEASCNRLNFCLTARWPQISVGKGAPG